MFKTFLNSKNFVHIGKYLLKKRTNESNFVAMRKTKLTIAQISDLHIGGGSDLVQDINVRENFRQALYSPSVEACDLVFLSGDLTDDGSIDGYEFVKREMEKRGKPWKFIIGNHDDYGNCFQIFEKGKECPFENTYDYVFECNGYRFVCLDTSKGVVTKEQFDWLREQDKVPGEFFLLTHYPPCICGHKFMDPRHALKGIEETQAVLAELKNLKHIFCGHYHSKYCITLPSGQTVHVAPPTQMQIDPEKETFSLKTIEPAWQVIRFGEGEPQVEVFGE